MSTIQLDRIVNALQSAGLLAEQRDPLPQTITAITDDSRAVVPGALFIAVRGTERDGHDYLTRAEAAGASVAIVEDASRTSLPAIVVRDGRRAAAIAAAAFHGEPARQLRFVAVTGTNGKTTTVGMLRHLLDDDDGRAASIGTLGVLVGSEGEPLAGGGGLTTPGPVELQRVLSVLVAAGVRKVAMEVSSHSLEQRRVDGLTFDAAVFTNLTRDHLDYHGTMEKYFAAKAKLISYLAPDGTAVVNADDRAWDALPAAPRRVRYAISSHNAEVRAEQVRFAPRGSDWTLAIGSERHAVHLPLIGDFNVANALGAAAAACAVGIAPVDIARRLSSLPQVPGRLEMLQERPTVLRDYAHTPDALERAITAVRPFTEGRLIVVFGCGGDRDKGKRPIMGGLAEQLADVAIVTSDNPRTESPSAIIDDIERGMTRPHERVDDRRAAIERALVMAKAGDVILLAGKGHETYQVVGTEKLPFDEKQIVHEITNGMRSVGTR